VLARLALVVADDVAAGVLDGVSGFSGMSSRGMIDQSSITSVMGTGIYFRASRVTIPPSCLSSVVGTVINVIRLEERGSVIPHCFVVVFASRSTSLNASAILSIGKLVARPISIPAYGPNASSP
jgi:hypothetical protein